LAVLFMYYVMMPVLLLFLVNFGVNIGMGEVKSAEPPPGTVFPVFPVLETDPVSPKLGEAWVNRGVMELRIFMAPPGVTQPASGSAGAAPVGQVYAAPLARSAGIVVQPRVVEFVNLFLTMALGFVVSFQTPVVVLLLGWIGVIKPDTLSK